MKFKQSLALTSIFISLVGCQSLPTETTSKPPQPTQNKTPAQEKTPSGVTTTPYEQPEIKRQPIVVQPPKQAVQRQHFEDGQQLPAFKQLMQQSQLALQRGQLDQAEQYAMQAQRLAPQSAENFLYLALIAEKRKQPNNAESLARRGLSFAQSKNLEKQLWQVIMSAGQQQNKAKVVSEAQAQLQRL